MSKEEIRKPLVEIAFLSLVLSVMIVFWPSPNVLESKLPIGQVAGLTSPDLPVRLIIPSINVDAPIQFVGVNSAGEMATPSSAFEVGWYKLGPIPGEAGNAVIAGHLDDKDGNPGVFSNLSKLKKGDRLYIENNQDELIKFLVRESRFLKPGYNDEVFISSDSAHLNLVTCGGIWDKNNKNYSERLIVFADKE